MGQTRWFFHPVFVLVLSILALGSSLFLYIYWYVEASTGLAAVARMLDADPSQFSHLRTWVVITVLSILVGAIMLGMVTIFVYNVQARRLYRIQRNFINNFTHELKTPVTSLKLYLETFAKHELPPEEKNKYLSYMLADVNRLSGNIARILNLAKIESKTYESELILCDLHEFIEKFIHENSHIFEKCEISLSNPQGHMLPCRINRFLFEMLLMNLLTNAMKYNHSQKPRVDISFEVRRKKLDVRFKDNGIGMEKKQIKRIFKKFYQVGKSDNMSAKGSGLGLYLVATIAKIHKGKIAAESRGLEQGSTFTLTLPFRW